MWPAYELSNWVIMARSLGFACILCGGSNAGNPVRATGAARTRIGLLFNFYARLLKDALRGWSSENLCAAPRFFVFSVVNACSKAAATGRSVWHAVGLVTFQPASPRVGNA